MDTVGIVAVCVSILGTALIFGCVFLTYKWYQIKQLNERLTSSSSSSILTSRSQRTKKLVVHRGKVIPARQSWTPSFRSGWTSMRRRSWMLASTMSRPSMPSLNKHFGRQSDDLEYQRPGVYSTTKTPMALTPVLDADDDDASVAQSDGKRASTVTTNAISASSRVTVAKLAFPMRPSLMDIAASAKKASPSAPAPAKTHRSVAKQQRAARLDSRKSMSDSLREQYRPSTAPARTTSKTKSKAKSQTFPRPPYLSPIQSRHNTRLGRSSRGCVEETASISQTSFLIPPTPSAKSFKTLSIVSTAGADSPPSVHSADLALMPAVTVRER